MSGSDSVSPPSSDSASISPSRRDFLKTTGLTGAMLLAGRIPMMAGPFTVEDFSKVVPADKKLSKDWIASLCSRGQALNASGQDLRYIGMPINGIGTGQVYLSGDGRLWEWNLDNIKYPKADYRGPRFLEPDEPYSAINQGFAIRIDTDGRGDEFRLTGESFSKVHFTSEAPMARVTFRDDKCPVEVELQAYTPYIPTNRDDSSYPVIIMRYTVKNPTDQAHELRLAGWIENVSNKKSLKGEVSTSITEYRELENLTAIECGLKIPDAADNEALTKLQNQADFGTLALGLFGEQRPDLVNLQVAQLEGDIFETKPEDLADGFSAERSVNGPTFGSLGRSLSLAPGESQTVSFALSWRFPNINHLAGNQYATLWSNATDAAATVAARDDELRSASEEWVRTWYDSTLPYWLLERAFIPVNCVQTNTARRYLYRDGSENYHFFEGTNCCAGNCTHVWHYGQGLGFLFPEIERECREKLEYGRGYHADGRLDFRYGDGKPAIDGQCGTILRVLRETRMSSDYAFLERVWPRVKQSMEYVIKRWDADEDGVLAGWMHNTLDADWAGQVHWLINLYHAALKASADMARRMNEDALAERYDGIVLKGAPAMVDMLWRDDYGYFIQKRADDDDKDFGSYDGCHIDQVLGDSWMWNVDLGRILPEEKIQAALESLWTFNFTPDVGPFRDVYKGGRWYAAAGNAGLIMCTFPHSASASDQNQHLHMAYLNECMTGFEWQVAAHMIWEGMTEKGLAIGKAIYDRYQPKDRNPYNEIECSDHYARAMASYGAYNAACGYQYDGPEGKLSFAPKLQAEDFRAAFTAAEGWGSFAQKQSGRGQFTLIGMRYGSMLLKEFAVEALSGTRASAVKVMLDGRPVDARFESSGAYYRAYFATELDIKAGQELKVSFS